MTNNESVVCEICGSVRVASENDEQRERRLRYLRQRAAHRVATENDEQRDQRLQDLRQRAAHRVATENEEQRKHRLEEQRRRDGRRRRALELNNCLPTYKCAVTAAVQYDALGPFEILCIHCGALHWRNAFLIV
ncbi:jg22427 [Pararge aegeria aegeria]|uniref:Jg22427 protein n=1 Tax=Pararge aegeria aegeria TaxID=348720 RepID=A0A8S4QVE9_9NEOP|nr:jg22427 [Pararge aegeria aegeria]